MLEALAIQHCPVSEWGGFMLEAMVIQHCPMLEWAVLCWRQWQFSIVQCRNGAVLFRLVLCAECKLCVLLQYEMVGDLFTDNEAHLMPRKRAASRTGKNAAKSKRSVGSEVCILSLQ